jgi:ribose/xylose/arabinose/galactoside ABC-type transport system permease subunit
MSTSIDNTTRISHKGQRHRRPVLDFFGRYNTIIIGLLIFIAASAFSDTFLTARNQANVLRQTAPIAISSMGMLLVILTGGIDLSVGSVSALGCVLTADFICNHNLPIPVAILLTVASGCLLGGVSGYLISVHRMPPFVVTLGMMTIARGLALIISEGHPIYLGDKGAALTDFGQNNLWGIPNQVLLALGVFLVTVFILKLTAFGRLVKAIGSNQEAVRLSGIRVGWYVFGVYVISGGLSALAGMVEAARSGVGSPVVGIGMELDVIAAVVIGGANLMGGRGTALNTIIGVLVLGIISNFMNLQNVPGYHQNVVKGVIILLAVLLQTGFRGRSQR